MTKKISENNILIITIILFGVFCIFDYVSAIDIINIGKNAVLTVIAVGASLFTFIAGIIIMIVIWAITHIAEYNNFINEPPIIGAWIIVRDLCNMFFILILLLIAFSTILRFEGYSIKKLLPKLVMMAVLINFSRMICGIIIDAGQIVMLTFISAIGNSGGNYIEHLGVQNYLNQTFTNDWSRDIDFFSVAGGMVLGAVFLVIAITVFIILLAMLAMRVVMLWIYIVLSPIAFLLSAFPGGQKYARQWWGDFAKQVVIGPLLAFFIWLSLVSANQVGNLGDIANTSCFGPQDIVCPANFINFVVAIGTLIAGMSVASSMGGVVGSTVQKLKAKDSIANLHRTGLKALGNYGIDKTHEKSGIDLNVGRVWKGIQTKRAEKQSERYSSGQQKAAEVMATRGRAWGALAMTGTPATAWEQITSKKGLRQRFTGGKRMAKKKDEFQDILDNKKFESDFVGANAEKRVEMRDNLLKEYPSIQNEIKAEKSKEGHEQDKNKIEKLEKKLEITGKNIKFAGADENSREFSEAEKKQYRDSAKEAHSGLGRYIPMYDFDARSADQDVVNKKMARIKDVTDADELLRVLEDAHKENDKAMIKAITKKMASQGDENEWLMPLMGNSGHKGLHKYTDKLQKEHGFSEQEAFALGSEISNISKANKIWSNAGAFKMENGRWRKATDFEQSEHTRIESGKTEPQTAVRTQNRKAYGYHDADNNFHIDAGGVHILRSLDNTAGIKHTGERMQMNAAEMLHKDLLTLNRLVEKNVISQELVNTITKRATEKGKTSDPSVKIEKVVVHEDLKGLLHEPNL